MSSTLPERPRTNTTTTTTNNTTMLPEVVTEYLVVGAGPAGASLACFLGQNGLKGLLIAEAPGTTETPRAHLVNPFAMECLRDIGMEDEAMRLALAPDQIGAMRYVQSLLGKELANLPHWEGNPETEVDVKRYTPGHFVDLPQSYMEPLLVKYASHHGFSVRFSTELEAVARDASTGEYLARVADHVRGDHYTIRTKFLFGADGGRSRVARDTGATFTSMPSQGVACNILFQADVGRLLDGKHAQLHTIVNPSAKASLSPMSIIRMIRPPREWMVLAFTPGVDATTDPYRTLKPTSPETTAWVRELIGLDDPHLGLPGLANNSNNNNDDNKNDDIPLTIQRIDPWVVRETVADTYQPCSTLDTGNGGGSTGGGCFLLGDAAHRHPPSYGLGSNTSLQDAYNLAWKVAYVARRLAGPRLLASYTAERQPVGAQLVRAANAAIGMHLGVWAALGVLPQQQPQPGHGSSLDGVGGGGDGGIRSAEAAHAELLEPGAVGEAARRRLHEALEVKMREGRSLGLCGNQFYDGAGADGAVFLDDEEGPRPMMVDGDGGAGGAVGPRGRDPIAHLHVSTYPGSRLPHAQLDTPLRRKVISTHDLAGHGAFCLLTGHGGEAWRTAAAAIAEATGLPLRAYALGYGLAWQDIYREWYARRGVEDSGCVLVRPDRFVAWRAVRMVPDCEAKLRAVLDRILCRDEL